MNKPFFKVGDKVKLIRVLFKDPSEVLQKHIGETFVITDVYERKGSSDTSVDTEIWMYRIKRNNEAFKVYEGELLYSKYLMIMLRERIGLEAYDTSNDKEFLTYSPFEIFQEWCEWQGIIGYAHQIVNVLEDLGITKKKGE